MGCHARNRKGVRKIVCAATMSFLVVFVDVPVNRPKAYLFCVNGTNTVADSTDLGHYISLTKDVRMANRRCSWERSDDNRLQNITALQDAAAGTSAILTVQYTSRYRPPPTELPKPPTLTTSPADDSKPLVHDNSCTNYCACGTDTLLGDQR